MNIFLIVLGYVTCGFFAAVIMARIAAKFTGTGSVEAPYDAGHAAFVIIFWPFLGGFYLAYATCRLAVEIGKKSASEDRK